MKIRRGDGHTYYIVYACVVLVTWLVFQVSLPGRFFSIRSGGGGGGGDGGDGCGGISWDRS